MGGRRRKGKKKLRPKEKMNPNPTADTSSSASPPPWIDLPRDVTENILRRLGPAEILGSAQRVCTTWRRVCDEPSLWRVIDMKCDDDQRHYHRDDTVCRRAVDRSNGGLLDINIEHFGHEELLLYISERSSHLKRLRILNCRLLLPLDLCTAVKNFPNLEELHLYFMPSFRGSDIEAIGISCPVLKSFTFHNRCSNHPIIDNDHALSIAKSMPNLLRLVLVGNLLSNEGLEAVLNGCPNLELLDLRMCFFIDLQCDIGRRCSEQIKELRRPLDSTAEFEWDDEDYDPLGDDGFSDDCYDYDSFGDDMDNFSDFGDDGFYEDYDDYTNPFNDLPYPANLVWYMGRDD